jgi:8-oxo-dGTP pyrophosphatase MutT (NUDIX family)
VGVFAMSREVTLAERLRQGTVPRQGLQEWMRQRINSPAVAGLPHFDGRIMMTAEECEVAKPAAVLVPLVDRPEGVQVLLTLRTDHLSDHAGQISFPGGRVDPEDLSPVAAALRETEEEIGLSRQHVQLLGTLREYFIPTGYRVVPAVGWVVPPFELNPDPFEVAEVFEVPLLHFFDPSRHVIHRDEGLGRVRRYFSIEWQGRTIWGATAGILVDLYRVLEGR